MWMLFVRAPPPDAAYWPGRRWLAALDALAWPAAWALLFVNAPVPVGIIAPVVVALAVMSATRRLATALWRNNRYRFTASRWGRIALGVLLIGWLTKLTLAVFR